MNFRSSKPFLEFSIISRKFCSRDDRHVAYSPSAWGSPGDAFAVLLSGTRVVSRSGSLGTRGATGACPGEYTRGMRGALEDFREGPVLRDKWLFRKAPG